MVLVIDSSEFYDSEKKKYIMSRSKEGEFDSDLMIDQKKLLDKIQFVGDNLFITNDDFVKKEIQL